MNSKKIPIYFIPGLAAGSRIFEFIQLPENKFEFHYLEWLMPLSNYESLENYAKRMVDLITEENPVLVGVSFGGIIVQEMSKHLNTKKVIIISSIKSKNEFPKRLKVAQKTKVYKLITPKAISNIEEFSIYAFGTSAEKSVRLHKEYLTVRNKKYLTWAIHHVLHWQQNKPLDNILHIHGTDDHIFPIKHIKNCIPIKKGTHVMILNKAKSISKIITDSFNC